MSLCNIDELIVKGEARSWASVPTEWTPDRCTSNTVRPYTLVTAGKKPDTLYLKLQIARAQNNNVILFRRRVSSFPRVCRSFQPHRDKPLREWCRLARILRALFTPFILIFCIFWKSILYFLFNSVLQILQKQQKIKIIITYY